MGYVYRLCIAIILVATSLGCGGNRTTSVNPTPAGQPPTPGQFSMPAPVGALSLVPDRTSSALLLERNGSDYIDGLAQLITDEFPSARFNPAWTGGSSGFGNLAYAIYNFNVQTYFGAELVTLGWGEAPLDYSNLWIGVGDWNGNNWDWYAGPADGILDLQAVGYSDYTKAGTGEMLVAVVMLGTNTALLDRLSVGQASNTAPVAVLHGSPLTGLGSIEVAFSAADSFDPDGGILDFEWDFDGDGIYNETGTEADNQGAAAPPLQTYTAALPVVVQVRVTDNIGATSTSSITVTVHGWVTNTPDSPGAVGEYSQMVIVDGNPAISYLDTSNYDLKYVRATDAEGSSWASPQVIDASGTVGLHTSLAIVDGYPAISYRDNTYTSLKYVRAIDVIGNTWSSPVTVDSDGNVGEYTSMAVVNGNPAICYYDYNNQDLKYVRSIDTSGSSWEIPSAVVTTGFVGTHAALVVVESMPAISYYDDTNDDLKFVRATDASGNAWGSPLAVDSAGSVGTYTSLAIVDGYPAISYYDSTNGNLKFVRAADTNGDTWETPLAVGVDPNVGWYSSLAIIDANPAISYSDWNAGSMRLKLVRALNASGSAWGTPLTIGSSVDTWSTSLIALDGYPAVSYYGSGDLKFARLY